MQRKDAAPTFSAADVAQNFEHSDVANQFPPILTPTQAAELLQVPLSTIYGWSSAGRLKSCSRKVGKHLRINRDRLLLDFFNKGLPIND